jgi:glutamate racemase
VNAWPEDGRGYNDFPDDRARAEVFDRALDAIADMGPDVLIIACNTLSILFHGTRFSRSAPFPVEGIIDAGVDVFVEALRELPEAPIVLLGTKTTIRSGEHRDRLLEAGVAPGRIAAVACHGLATAIERDIDGPAAELLMAVAADDVRAALPTGSPVLLGLCCTHYGYVADRLGAAVAGAVGRPVKTLDPNVRLVETVMAGLAARGGGGEQPVVEVVSKVALDERTRTGIGGLVRAASPATAAALRDYRHVPDLF